jgi:hypothetical protein
MDDFVTELTSEHGLFAGLFVALLVFFGKYINKHNKEVVKMNHGLGKRLNEVERYVKDTLVEILVETRAVLTHSTKINEMALRELQKKQGDLTVTDTQELNKVQLKKLVAECLNDSKK